MPSFQDRLPAIQRYLPHGGEFDSIGLEVPETLRQMIEAQIDRLSPDEQLVLEVASLASAGDSRFAVVPGAAAAELEPEAFEHACEKLVRRHCILRAAKPQKFPVISERREWRGSTTSCVMEPVF